MYLLLTKAYAILPVSEEMAATTYRGASTNFATGSMVYYWESSTMATL